jgi:hypothetical protein
LRAGRGSGVGERVLDLLGRRPPIAGIGFQDVDGTLQQFMDEFAVCPCIEGERLLVLRGCTPAERVLPYKGERIAEQQAQRGCRLRLIEGEADHGVAGPNAAVMGGRRRAAPMDPSLRGGGNGRQRCRFLRSCCEPVALAERMGRDAVTLEHRRRSERSEERT